MNGQIRKNGEKDKKSIAKRAYMRYADVGKKTRKIEDWHIIEEGEG